MPLALMAPQIRRARLGPAGVSLARMAPVDIVANTALLAQMARGGVSVGLVRGAWLEEHGVREVERPLRAMREGVAVIRHLLSGASGGLAGELYPLAEHVRAPWAQPGGKQTPVMIGSWGPRLSALAGEIAEELKVGGSASAAMVPYARGWLARGEERAGRAPGSVTLAVGAVSVVAEREGREVAREAARRSVALYLPVVAALDPSASVEPELIERVRSHTRQRDEAGAARLISDELLDRFAFSGDAGDLIRQAEALITRARHGWSLARRMVWRRGVASASSASRSFLRCGGIRRSPEVAVQQLLQGLRTVERCAGRLAVDAAEQAGQHSAGADFEEAGRAIGNHVLQGFAPAHRAGQLAGQLGAIGGDGEQGRCAEVAIDGDGRRAHGGRADVFGEFVVDRGHQRGMRGDADGQANDLARANFRRERQGRRQAGFIAGNHGLAGQLSLATTSTPPLSRARRTSCCTDSSFGPSRAIIPPGRAAVGLVHEAAALAGQGQAVGEVQRISGDQGGNLAEAVAGRP